MCFRQNAKNSWFIWFCFTINSKCLDTVWWRRPETAIHITKYLLKWKINTFNRTNILVWFLDHNINFIIYALKMYQIDDLIFVECQLNSALESVNNDAVRLDCRIRFTPSKNLRFTWNFELNWALEKFMLENLDYSGKWQIDKNRSMYELYIQHKVENLFWISQYCETTTSERASER